MVTLAFSDALGPSSEIKVVRTVTVLPTGEELATGGTPVAEASGTAALSADGRALRVRLPDGSPGGLYYDRWTAVRAGSRVERFGDLYFGVGMAVPEHIVSSGVLDEHDPDKLVDIIAALEPTAPGCDCHAVRFGRHRRGPDARDAHTGLADGHRGCPRCAGNPR